ncbi:MAG: aldo/keto reductase [Spirochaetes bacterium]|uniref:Aldo/keto reductase n=1 Tax=Candidatus Avitreponema avistercoris TaxID=2840705 RepID=A0A9D9ELC2_9SPIR|nr:aldo/keto reductase [Candidatus Avitreponema avistercoris]
MVYRNFKDLQISALGLGTMRLPVIRGEDSAVDQAQVNEMVKMAVEGGVNYFDTAWGYHGGNSETSVAEALQPYPRASYFLADKFPGYDLANFGKTKEIFARQLEKCRTDYFDFYLFHNVCELNISHYLDEEKWHTYSDLIRLRDEGKIRHLGFSCHGDMDVLQSFLNAYGKDMEFCQLQINWIDWRFQNAGEKVELLNKWNIPVWVMEPLRGGKLASLRPEDGQKLHALRPGETVPAWAFRFLQSVPGVTVILSGMSSAGQLAENLRTFRDERPLNAEEWKTLTAIGDEMVKQIALPCTACRYCVPHCPKHLDIPRLLSFYNEHVFTGGGFLAPMALASFDKDKLPSECIGCGSCRKVCPQGIDIPAAMKDFTAKVGA